MKTGLAIPCVAVLSFVLGMTLESARGKAAEPAGHVTGIGGVFFKSSDPQKLAAWYRDNLGIELTPATYAHLEKSTLAPAVLALRAGRFLSNPIGLI